MHVANLEALCWCSLLTSFILWWLLGDSKLCVDVCLTDINTGLELQSPLLAAGSEDRNFICLGLQGRALHHRPGNLKPLGEPGALSSLFDPSLSQPSLGMLGTLSSSWNLYLGLVWGWNLFPFKAI